MNYDMWVHYLYIYTEEKCSLLHIYIFIAWCRFPCFDYFPLTVYYKRSINLPVYVYK